MKKLSYLLGLFVVAGLIFSACSKDDDEDEPDPPVAEFKSGLYPGWGVMRVTGDTTLTSGDPFVFGIKAESKSDKNLKRVLITRTFMNTTPNIMEDITDIDAKTFDFDKETVARPNLLSVGTEVFTVTVTDANNLSVSISFTVTTNPIAPTINTYNGIQLGSYENTSVGNVFSSSTGETFSFEEANNDPAIQAKVDWAYFNSSVWGNTLMSPGNTDVYEWYDFIAAWSTKKITHFAKTTLTAAQYNSVVSQNIMVTTIQNQGLLEMNQSFYSENISDPGGFEVGDIIAFRAQPGKFGLLQVTAVNPGANVGVSTITFNIKVIK
jgi:hypothetical protein